MSGVNQASDAGSRPIYLDCAATTPVDPRVVDAMVPFLHEHFGNPASSSHAYGWAAERAVQQARAQVAALVGADQREIVFTSGATESINLALKGAARFHRARGRRLLSARTEHKATIDSLLELEREGFQLDWVEVGGDGLIDPQAFRRALRDDTVLASVMYVNNEIGVVQDIAALGHYTRERGILLHVDAAQATGKLPIELVALPVDLMSFSAHKTYGPKGIGALYVSRHPRARLEAQMHGGGHEGGLRSGTLATHQIVGMGEAFRIAGVEMSAERERIRGLHERLWQGLAAIGGVRLNGSAQHRVPHNLNIAIEGIDGLALILGLSELAISSGSACVSAAIEPSYVLRALGISHELAQASIRLGIGRFNTADEIDRAVAMIAAQVSRQRGLDRPGQSPDSPRPGVGSSRAHLSNDTTTPT